MNFLHEFTIGNFITLAAMMLGGVLAWQKLKDIADESRRRIEQLESDARSRASAVAQIDATLAGLAADLSWIRENLRDRRGADPGPSPRNHR